MLGHLLGLRSAWLAFSKACAIFLVLALTGHLLGVKSTTFLPCKTLIGGTATRHAEHWKIRLCNGGRNRLLQGGRQQPREDCDKARHGHEPRRATPSGDMSLQRADSLMQGIVKACLRSKC
jgi:hypothetical protein